MFYSIREDSTQSALFSPVAKFRASSSFLSLHLLHTLFEILFVRWTKTNKQKKKQKTDHLLTHTLLLIKNKTMISIAHFLELRIDIGLLTRRQTALSCLRLWDEIGKSCINRQWRIPPPPPLFFFKRIQSLNALVDQYSSERFEQLNFIDSS